jgi:rubrerythrin
VSGGGLLEFLAYSAELEREAGERYAELAEAMGTHHNTEVADFFRHMAREAENHLADVAEIAGDRSLPAIAPWDFQWPEAEAPETASYEALHYRMSLREAMQLALANEQAAEGFYREYARRSDNADVRDVATRFADEERSHARYLEEALKDLPESSPFNRVEDDPPLMPE